MSVNFALMARIRGDFSVEQLNAALAKVRTRHVTLLTRSPRDGSRVGTFLPEDAPLFPLRVLEGCGEDDWLEVVSSELHTTFPDGAPMARFVLLRLKDRSDLIAVFHHWGSDGMSGAYVLRDTLQALGHPDVPLTPIAVQPNAVNLLPEAATRNPATMLRIAARLATIRWRVFVSGLRAPAAATQQQPSEPRVYPPEELARRQKIHLLPGSLSATQTSALIERCRAEGTSVHAALCVAWLAAFAELSGLPLPWKRTVSSPVNLRQRLSQPVPDTSGGYLALININVDCSPGRDFWQVAREFKQKLSHASTDDRVFFMQLMMRGIDSLALGPRAFGAVGSLFSGHPDYDYSITNLGRLDFPAQYGPLHVEAFYGPLVNSGELERTVGVNTFDGRLTYALLFRRSTMEPEWARKLMQCALEKLGAAVGW